MRSPRSLAFWSLASLAVSVAACNGISIPEATFACTTDDECPKSWRCGPDSLCHAALGTGEDAGSSDAALDAAGVVDSVTDGGSPEDAGTTEPEPTGVGAIPRRPASSTSDDADSVDVAFSLRDVDIAQHEATIGDNDPAQPWRSIGSDLDGVNTTHAAAPMSCGNGWTSGSSHPSPMLLDGVDGIDNSYGSNVAGRFFRDEHPNLQDAICCSQARGRGALVVRITRWNGESDDASVTVAILMAADGTSTDPAAVSLVWDTDADANELVLAASPSTRAPIPGWAPDEDTFYVSNDDLSAGDLDSPKHVDTNAYVRNGAIVMRLDSGRPIPLHAGSTNGTSLVLGRGTMVARLSHDRRYVEYGMFVGRIDLQGLLDARLRLLGSSGAQPACDLLATETDGLVDDYGDVLVSGENDPTSSCDAISAGVRFRGVRVRGLRVASAPLRQPFPLCNGRSDGVCTATPDDTACPSGSSVCAIPPWNGP